jgi:mRNA interferase MazF
MRLLVTGSAVRRGEVRFADLEPARGSEADKRRPVVVVSNNRANAAVVRLGRGVVTIVPLTSNVRRILPFQVLLPAASSGLEQDSKAQAEQVRSIAVERMGSAVDQLPVELMDALDEALRLHLGL